VLPELSTREVGCSYNDYAEGIIRIIRRRHQRTYEAVDLSAANSNTLDYFDQEQLHEGIRQLITKEIQSRRGAVTFVWTGKKYEEYSSFYKELYTHYLPAALQRGISVTHLLADGNTTQEKLQLVDFLMDRILRLGNNELFKARVVRNLTLQSFVNDVYATKNSGTIVAVSAAALGEASVGVWTQRREGFSSGI
jgi:hypothetical protein